MRVRSFSLIDYYGNTWSLDDPEGTGFLTEPSGLGYEYDYNYLDIGDAFVRTKMKGKQSEISGTLIFGSQQPYAQFEAFNRYVRTGKSLKLVYNMPHTNTTYYRDVDLVLVEKGEMEDGVLKIPVRFLCTSLFYSNVIDNFVITTIEGELRYTIEWPAKYNDYSDRAVLLTNDSDVDAPFTATMAGYCEYPTISLRQNGITINSVTFPLILQVGEIIYYSSLDDDLYAYYVDSQGNRENIVQLLDINNDNFFKIPVGDYEISFSSDTGAAYTSTLSMYKFYRTV